MANNSSTSLRLRVGYELIFDCPQPTPMALMLNIHHIHAGDIVVGDQDGVVIIPRARIAETLKQLETVRKLEAGLEAKVKAGLKKSGIVDSILTPGAIKEVD